MKRTLLIMLIVFSLQPGKTNAQAVYSIYASEPSGMLASPNSYSRPNTATVRSGDRIVLNGYYDQGLALWFGEGLSPEGAVFGTSVQLINTGTEIITRTFKVNNNNTNAITVTILPQQGVSEPMLSTASFCVPNPVLTATGCSGSLKWYTRSVNQFSVVSKTQIPGAEDAVYTVTSPNTYFASCTVGGVESFGSEAMSVGAGGIQPGIFLSSPHPRKSYPNAKSDICMWSDYTLEASGLGLGAGDVTWYEKIGSDAVNEIGTGQTKNVEVTNRNTNYYATLSVPGCDVKTSGTHTFQVQTPSALATSAERSFVVHGQSMNILADDNCQVISGFIPNENNNGLNVMLGKTIKAKVTVDNTVKLYHDQPYLRRHFDFEPDNLAEAENAWYSVVMYFTQADFDAFNAASSVKLPSNSSIEEQQKLVSLRIWQTHGTPVSLPATPGNYSGGPVTDYGCGACRNTVWNEENGWWEVHFNTLGFSGFFITAEGATALPITLLNFEARKQENSIALNWQTTEETNSDHFEIQRSTDAKNWKRTAQVQAKGESTVTASYSYDDPLSQIISLSEAGDQMPSALYYRLKMLDRDGTFAYSRIASVNLETDQKIIVYPNPAAKQAMLISNVPIIRYKLVDLTGRVLKEVNRLNSARIDVDLTQTAAGLYVLELSTSDGKTESRNLVVQ